VKCQHASDCSQPNRYWRWREYSEIVDGEGKLVENVIPDTDKPHGIVWACTECGERATYETPTVKPEKRKPASQMRLQP
jgi:hypothetical protein